jgi:hypothetical protein
MISYIFCFRNDCQDCTVILDGIVFLLHLHDVGKCNLSVGTRT